MITFETAIIVALITVLGNLALGLIGYVSARRKQKTDDVQNLSATATEMVDTALSMQKPLRESLTEANAEIKELHQERELLIAQAAEIQRGYDDTRDALQYLAGRVKSDKAFADAVRIAFTIANRRTKVIRDSLDPAGETGKPPEHGEL